MGKSSTLVAVVALGATATLASPAGAELPAGLHVGAAVGFASGTDAGSFDDGSVSLGVDALVTPIRLYGGDLSVGGTVIWARWESRVDRTAACWDPATGGLRLVGSCPAGDIPVAIERAYLRSSWLFEALAQWHRHAGLVRPYARLGIGLFRLGDAYDFEYRQQETGDLVLDESGTSPESGLALSFGAGVHVLVTETFLLGAGVEQHSQRRPGDEAPFFEDIRIFSLRVAAALE